MYGLQRLSLLSLGFTAQTFSIFKGELQLAVKIIMLSGIYKSFGNMTWHNNHTQ